MTSFTTMGNTTTYGSYTTSTNVGVDLISGVEKVTVLGNPFASNLSFSIESTKNINSESKPHNLVESTPVIHDGGFSFSAPSSSSLLRLRPRPRRSLPKQRHLKFKR